MSVRLWMTHEDVKVIHLFQITNVYNVSGNALANRLEEEMLRSNQSRCAGYDVWVHETYHQRPMRLEDNANYRGPIIRLHICLPNMDLDSCSNHGVANGTPSGSPAHHTVYTRSAMRCDLTAQPQTVIAPFAHQGHWKTLIMETALDDEGKMTLAQTRIADPLGRASLTDMNYVRALAAMFGIHNVLTRTEPSQGGESSMKDCGVFPAFELYGVLHADLCSRSKVARQYFWNDVALTAVGSGTIWGTGPGTAELLAQGGWSLQDTADRTATLTRMNLEATSLAVLDDLFTDFDIPFVITALADQVGCLEPVRINFDICCVATSGAGKRRRIALVPGKQYLVDSAVCKNNVLHFELEQVRYRQRKMHAGHPTVAHMFAGIGAMRLRTKINGLRTVASADCSIHATATYNRNFRTNEPLRDVMSGSMLRMFMEQQPDMLTAGPPCQPMAVGGKHRGMQDERFKPFLQTLKYIWLCEPVVTLLESSTGILAHPESLTLVSLFCRLTNTTPKSSTLRLQAVVPWKRERSFLYLCRDDCPVLPSFDWPREAVAPLTRSH